MEIPFTRDEVQVRYQEKKRGEEEWDTVVTFSPALGVPIKVTRPKRDGTFETVMTDTLSNAKYMADYQKWLDGR